MRDRPPRPIYPERGYLPYNAGPDRSLEAVTLSEMVECIRPCDTDVWRSRFLTRTFWMRWSGKPPEVQTAMIAEEPLPLGVRWDAFIAGYAQELSVRYRLPPPGWALKPGRYLDHVWPIFDQGGIGMHFTAIAPAPFLLEHGILLRDYEMSSAQQLIEGEGSVITWKSPDWRSDRIRPGAPAPQDALDAFEVMSRRFEEDGVCASVHLTGGEYFTLARFPGLHFTTGEPRPLTLTEADRGAIQEAGHTAVREAVAAAAQEHGWPPDWLSRLPVPALDAGGPAASLSLFYHPCLQVRASSPAHLAGLLMLSGRRQDTETLSRLLPHLPDRSRTPDGLTAAARRFAPASQTPDADLRATAEAALRCAAISA